MGAEHLPITSKGGPSLVDVYSRKVWSLSTGRLVDECVVEDVPDDALYRKLVAPDDLRVELTLKNSMELFERKGPDIAEIFSQPRICQELDGRKFSGQTLRPGWSLDLTMRDPKTGEPWDLSRPEVQSRVIKLVRDTQPYFVIGSPPCTPFSPLQEISRSKRDPKVMAEELRRGKEHVNFCVKVYMIQIQAKRHFIHEHPEASTAWKNTDLVQLAMEPQVDATTLHMCAYGMQSEDEHGKGLVKKATRILSSSPEVLKKLAARCSNESGDSQHRHVHLIQGRAKAAQVYPREFSMRVCEGVAAQQRLDSLGLQSLPIMSVDAMHQAAGSKGTDECPSQGLHEVSPADEAEGLVAWDDVSGQQLDAKLMVAARKEEIKYFREMGVYEKVDVSESWKETGKAPIAVRWVDINKGDSKSPKYRSRLVAKEFNTGVRPELYAATPPSECLRLMLSLLASNRKQGHSLIYADVSRAYFYAKAVRPVYVKLPQEDLEPGDENRCGRLKMSMYGTRDAALNWSLEYGDTLRAGGYVQGRANPCLFHNAKLGVSVMVHGDDFIAVGPDQHLKETIKTLEDKYKLKTEKLGHGKGEMAEIRILNKVVRMTNEGIELEADPRHAELVIKELGLQGAKPSPVPGSKDEAKKSAGSTPESRRAERQIDSINDARTSLKNEIWESEHSGEVAVELDDDDELLGPEDARLYRGVAARLNYVAPDRSDIAYAVKEAARNMSSPTASGLRRLKKIGRYLIGVPRLVSKFNWQDMPTVVTAFTDSDWAGCIRTAKSTSGGAICIGEHVVKTYCRQQKVVALSSAEAELYAMVAASAETLAMAAYAADLGIPLGCELYCDSSAALGIAQRAGIGKVRHLRTHGLWVQEVRVAGRIVYRKVLGAKNPADLMTKHMSAELSGQHLRTLNMDIEGGRAASAPTLDNIESFVQGWYEDLNDEIEKQAETQEEITEKSGAPPVERDLANEPLELERRNGNGRKQRNVSFSRKVQLRPIPLEGRGRKTPTRGGRAASQSRWAPRETERADAPIDQFAERTGCAFGIAGIAIRGDGKRWADFPEDGIEARRSAEPTGVIALNDRTEERVKPGSCAHDHSVSHTLAQEFGQCNAHSSGMCSKTRIAGTVSALKSRVAGNVVVRVSCAESDGPRHLQEVDGYAGRKFESCGPRSGLHANARTVKSACNDFFHLQDASFSKASSAAGGAQNVEQSSRADRDALVHRRWRRNMHMRQYADCQSRRNPFHSGGSRLYSSALP